MAYVPAAGRVATTLSGGPPASCAAWGPPCVRRVVRPEVVISRPGLVAALGQLRLRFRPGGADLVAAVAVGGIGPLPGLDRAREVELQVGDPSQAFDDVPRGRLAQGILERSARGGVAGAQRRTTFLDQARDRRAHRTIIFVPRATTAVADASVAEPEIVGE
jgi:hypothetical protein